MTASFILVGALFGLALGSFLNVVVYRTPLGLSVVRPGSFCPRCKTEITSRDNVPVLGWLWLRGKCRACGEPISVRYPLVEAGTAAIFIGIAATVRPLFGVPGWWALSATLGVAALIEVDGKQIPASIPFVGGSIGLVALGIGSGVDRHLGPLPEALIGLGGGLVVAGAAAISSNMRNRIGLGPLLMLPLFGTCLGWLGGIPSAGGWAVSIAVVLGLAFYAIRKRATSPAPGITGLVATGRLPWATAFCFGVFAALLIAALRT
jgi:leader peptidase (prepilin peptidase) / N-methyltransferase